MSSTLGWLAVILAGFGGPNPSKGDGPEVSYQFKVVEIEGLDWRLARGHGLKSVASRGGTTVWTAPEDFFKSLPEGTVKVVLAGPTITSREHAVAHFSTRRNQPFVTQASWRGEDAPPRETTEQVREGMAATIRGRRLDQGILSYLVIEDTGVHAVHTLNVPACTSSCPKTTTKTAHAGEPSCPVSVQTASTDVFVAQACFGSAPEPACCATDTTKTACCADEKAKVCTENAQADTAKCCSETTTEGAHNAVQLQIPEIGRSEIAGEWLIPRDEVLLVGFGPHTVADKDGKAVVRERLAVISADVLSLPTAATGDEQCSPPLHVPKLTRPTAATASAIIAPGMPAMPSRTLPQGVNTDGSIADLPPLTDETASEDPAEQSAEPKPSPQAKRPSPEAPAEPAPPSSPPSNTDARTTKASFNLPRGLFRPAAAALPALGLPNLQFMVPLKPFELKLPLNQKLQLELIGKVVPDTEGISETVTIKD